MIKKYSPSAVFRGRLSILVRSIPRQAKVESALYKAPGRLSGKVNARLIFLAFAFKGICGALGPNTQKRVKLASIS